MSKFSARAKIEAMLPGASLEFSTDEIAKSSVAYYVSHLGRRLNREYHMRTAKSRGVYIITREA